MSKDQSLKKLKTPAQENQPANEGEQNQAEEQ